jgi:hypothetical protein
MTPGFRYARRPFTYKRTDCAHTYLCPFLVRIYVRHPSNAEPSVHEPRTVNLSAATPVATYSSKHVTFPTTGNARTMFLTMHTLDRSTEPALNLASAFSDLPPCNKHLSKLLCIVGPFNQQQSGMPKSSRPKHMATIAVCFIAVFATILDMSHAFQSQQALRRIPSISPTISAYRSFARSHSQSSGTGTSLWTGQNLDDVSSQFSLSLSSNSSFNLSTTSFAECFKSELARSKIRVLQRCRI